MPPVADLMSREVITLQRNDRLMLERKVGCLPVVEGETLVGILTEGDFVSAAATADPGEPAPVRVP